MNTLHVDKNKISNYDDFKQKVKEKYPNIDLDTCIIF